MERLKSVLALDGMRVSEEILHLLEDEITKVVKNFVVLSSAVKVRFTRDEDGINFTSTFAAKSIRPLGYIPR